MKLKRLMTLALAGVLSTSMISTAFAANTTEISGSYKDVEIAVTVPTTGQAFINPYGLPIELDDTAKTKITGEQITTLPLGIENKSDVNLDVHATVTGKITGRNSTMEFATQTTKKVSGNNAKEADTSKLAFVELEMVTAPTGVTSMDAAKGWYAKFADKDNWTGSQFLTVGTEAASNDADSPLISKLKKGSSGASVAGGVAFFRLTGDCVASPEDDPWTANDTFSVSVAFTFIPSEDQA